MAVRPEQEAAAQEGEIPLDPPCQSMGCVPFPKEGLLSLRCIGRIHPDHPSRKGTSRR